MQMILILKYVVKHMSLKLMLFTEESSLFLTRALAHIICSDTGIFCDVISGKDDNSLFCQCCVYWFCDNVREIRAFVLTCIRSALTNRGQILNMYTVVMPFACSLRKSSIQYFSGPGTYHTDCWGQNVPHQVWAGGGSKGGGAQAYEGGGGGKVQGGGGGQVRVGRSPLRGAGTRTLWEPGPGSPPTTPGLHYMLSFYNYFWTALREEINEFPHEKTKEIDAAS